MRFRVPFVACLLLFGGERAVGAGMKGALVQEAQRVSHTSAEKWDWAANAPAISFRSKGEKEGVAIRLYTDAGEVDTASLRKIDHLGGAEGHPLSPRVIQLIVKAAMHFNDSNVVVVSAYREGHAGKHSTSEAVDFECEHVKWSALASYLRGQRRVGVGVYTHPKTHYVHLDVRDESFHWFDASPPGKRWREKGITDSHAKERDAAYAPTDDLPEH